MGVPIGGMCVRQPMTIGGSGSSYLYGMMDHTYRANMPQKECEDLVLQAVTQAIRRDGSSGGCGRTTSCPSSTRRRSKSSRNRRRSGIHPSNSQCLIHLLYQLKYLYVTNTCDLFTNLRGANPTWGDISSVPFFQKKKKRKKKKS